MKALRNYLDKIKPNFEAGGKFSYLGSVFDGFETFLFVPNATSKSGAHIHDGNDSKRLMIMVVIALIPATLFGMYNIGYQHYLAVNETADLWNTFLFGFIKLMPMIIVSYAVGLGLEFVIAQLRGHEIQEGYLVSGILIPLIVPVNLPMWMLAVAVIFAVIFAKEVFGGTGMNIFNVALVTRAFLFFAYPKSMSGDSVWVAGNDAGKFLDGFSGATPLAHAASTVDLNIAIKQAVEAGDVGLQTSLNKTLEETLHKIPDAWHAFIGLIPGSVGETSTLAILIGGLIMLIVGVASWKVMLSVFAGGFTMGLIFNMLALNPFMSDVSAIQHLCLGGFAFGAVFMATDPVTAARTETGKWIYGFMIGLLAILLRVVNPAYPEGMMLAILFMNMFAPLIDHYVVQANISKRLKRAAKQIA